MRGCTDGELRGTRMRYLSRKRAAEKEEAYCSLRKQAAALAKFEEFKIKHPESQLTMTKYIKQNKLWERPKYKSKTPRWVDEKGRNKHPLDKQGEKVGFGTFYKIAYNDYTCEELICPQGLRDRPRTVDLNPTDVVKRELTEDDSDLESDWLDRTGKPLFHVEEPKPKDTPNRTYADITLGKGNNAIRKKLPSAYAADAKLRTNSQQMDRKSTVRKDTDSLTLKNCMISCLKSMSYAQV